MPVQVYETVPFDWTDHSQPGSPSFHDALTNVEDLKLSGEHMPLNPNGDSGGAFLCVKTVKTGTTIDQKHYSIAQGYPTNCRSHGNFTVAHNLTGIPALSIANITPDIDLIAMGTTAIARVAPSNPSSGLGVALGEVAGEGIPSAIGYTLWKERATKARAAGSEYLNSEFGWLPLINDIRSFASAVKQSDDILHQYVRDSDRKIRRRYYFPTESQSAAGIYRAHSANPNTFAPGFMGVTYKSFSRSVWFSGAFRYHIPTSPTQLGKFRHWASMADHLLGVKPTPEMVWNLAPWSWAADWFSNTGDVMTNISNLGRDGMVMQYGYIMCESRDETITAASMVNFDPRYRNAYSGLSASRKTTNVVMQRYKATPYGFGINLDSLSTTQIAVLAALGLSRT